MIIFISLEIMNLSLHKETKSDECLLIIYPKEHFVVKAGKKAKTLTRHSHGSAPFGAALPTVFPDGSDPLMSGWWMAAGGTNDDIDYFLL